MSGEGTVEALARDVESRKSPNQKNKYRTFCFSLFFDQSAFQFVSERTIIIVFYAMAGLEKASRNDSLFSF